MSADEKNCYCADRKIHPEDYVHIPEGYCALCDVCGNPGHVLTHPFKSATGAWCNECWRELLEERERRRNFTYILIGLFILVSLLMRFLV